MMKNGVTPLVRCKTKPISDALAGGETLNFNGGVRREVHDGKYGVLDVPERGAGAGGVGAEEGAVLWS